MLDQWRVGCLIYILYLLGSYERVVEMLISCLLQNGNDGFFEGNLSSPQQNLDNLITINMIIATLQKLSLK